MEFFDKLTKKASEAYKITADKTGKIAKETKLKLKISELKSEINDLYEEIGKKEYEKHTRRNNGETNIEDICKQIEEKCLKIDVLSDEIENLLKQCLELNDKKQCEKCYTEIEKKAKFCPHCGAKQEAEVAIEAEVLENQTTHIENDIETEVEKEEIEIDQAGPVVAETSEGAEQDNSNKDEEQETEKTNLEKTVEIESNVETDEDEKEIEKSQEEVSKSEEVEENEENK